MTTDPPKASNSGRWQFSLRTLVITHIVASLVACWVASIALRKNIFAPLVSIQLANGQMCLLGIWLALGTNSGRCRVAGTLAGISFLTMINAYYISSVFPVPMGVVLRLVVPLITLPTLGVAAVLLIIRVWKAHLVPRGSELPAAAVEGLRFSIRHLFLLTTAVAVLLVMAQGVGLLLKNTPWLQTAGIISMLTLCLIAITLAAVWAGMGVVRPSERIVVVMLLAFFTGVLFAYVETFYMIGMVSWQQAWRRPTNMVLTATVVIASLLVVRSNGYRLVRRSP